MIKRAAPLCFLLFILTACLSERSLTAPAADRGEWKNAYQGEEVFLVTQGTVAVEAVNMLIREIPGARWTARFDYDSDISGNYIVLDFTDEKAELPWSLSFMRCSAVLPFPELFRSTAAA